MIVVFLIPVIRVANCHIPCRTNRKRSGESSCSSGVERVLGKDEVAGSIPAKSSTSEQKKSVCFNLRHYHGGMISQHYK